MPGVMIMVVDMRDLVAHVRGQLSLCAQTIGHMPFARAYVASYPHKASINYVGCPVWMDVDTLSGWQGMVIFEILLADGRVCSEPSGMMLKPGTGC